MSSPPSSVAAVRVAVRRVLSEVVRPGERVLVACSGGADSLALAAAVSFEGLKRGIPAGLVTVDHALQSGSAEQAEAVAAHGKTLGLDPVIVRRVTVGGDGGLEAAARVARYAALREAAEQTGAAWVLLGHSLDDQAETVLLGLGRGSGPRSIAGMREVDRPWLRPLLALPRATLRDACLASSLTPWDDPHNTDQRFRRVGLRTRVLPILEETLGGGVAAALARTATVLREDLDALDEWESELFETRVTPAMAGNSVAVSAFADLPVAMRRRLLRAWLRANGIAGLSAAHIWAVDELVSRWKGQGRVALPHRHALFRRHGRLHLVRI